MLRRPSPWLRRPAFTGRWTPHITAGQSAWRLLALGFAAAALTAVAWATTTQTMTGQQIADAILYGRNTADLVLLQAANETLAVIGLGSAAVAALGLVTFALVRGGPVLAGGTAVLLAGANLTSLALKAALERPHLLGASAYSVGNSFPSGTVTLVASIALAAILVAPRRLRSPAALAAAVVITAVGESTIIAGWHRLADVAGAMMIALAWASIGTGLLVWIRGWMPRRSWHAGVGGRAMSATAAAGATAVVGGATGVAAVVVNRPYLHELIAARAADPVPFAAALVIVAGAALLACTAYVVAMRGIAFERRG